MVRTRILIDESKLSKGETRKLTALRKSLGPEIADEAFAKWYDAQVEGAADSDPNVKIFGDLLNPLLDQIRIPRGTAYVLRRGRGRFIIEPITTND